MCLLITALAAVITTLVWYFKGSGEKLRLETLALMYWGATLMWLVDGFFLLSEGEPFLDTSWDDALLGFVIVLSGLVVWTALLLYDDPKDVLSRRFSSNHAARGNE